MQLSVGISLALAPLAPKADRTLRMGLVQGLCFAGSSSKPIPAVKRLWLPDPQSRGTPSSAPHPRRHAARPVHLLVSGHARQRCPARPIRCRSLSCPTVSGALPVRLFHRVVLMYPGFACPTRPAPRLRRPSTWKSRRYRSAVFGQYGISWPTFCQRTNDRKLALRRTTSASTHIL